MKVYLDTSILVSIYCPEKQTESARKLLDENFGEIYISRLCQTEFYSALSMKQRTKQLTPLVAKKVQQSFQQHVDATQYELLHVTDEVFTTAIGYIPITLQAANI